MRGFYLRPSHFLGDIISISSTEKEEAVSNLLIRGLSDGVRRKIQRLAAAENLSINQEVIRLIVMALEQAEGKKEMEERRAEAFRRIRELRKQFHQKYGMLDDSTKLIREDRENH
jgi:plasmid stability protein